MILSIIAWEEYFKLMSIKIIQKNNEKILITITYNGKKMWKGKKENTWVFKLNIILTASAQS